MNKEQKVEIQSPEHSFPSQIIKGFVASFNAFKIVSAHRKLWFYFIIPFIINLILLSVIFYFTYYYVYPSLLNVIPAGSAWYLSIFRWIVGPLIAVSFAVIYVFLYSITGNIITAPFNDPLSAKVEELLSGKTFAEKFSFSSVLKDILRVLKNTVKLADFVIDYSTY